MVRDMLHVTLFAPAPTIRLNYICGFRQMGWASQLAAKESITELNKLLCISRRHSRPEWGIYISTFEMEWLGCIMRYVCTGLVFIEWGDCISVLVISKCNNWVSHIAPWNALMVFNEWRISILYSVFYPCCHYRVRNLHQYPGQLKCNDISYCTMQFAVCTHCFYWGTEPASAAWTLYDLIIVYFHIASLYKTKAIITDWIHMDWWSFNF